MNKVDYSFYPGISLKITLCGEIEIRKMIEFISQTPWKNEYETGLRFSQKHCTLPHERGSRF
jgi:hypothetical protein